MEIKNDLIKLIKKNPIAILVIVIVIAVFVVYAVVFTPMTAKMSAKYLECRQRENDVLSARNIIEYSKSISKSYGGRVLISEKESATGIDEFTKHANGLGIDFLSVKPQNVIFKEGTPYKVMPIEMELEANDKQFVDFIGSIDELKKAIVTVNNFDITPDPNNRTKLHVKMTIDIYLSATEGLES